MSNAAATKKSVVAPIEDFIRSYAAMREHYYFPLTLWAIGTHCYDLFDSYPRLVVTAVGPESGKTRVLELIRFFAQNAAIPVKVTAAGIYSRISEATTGLTILIDEAEGLSRSDANDLRAVLNGGYRKGESVWIKGQEYKTYAPIACALIGDVTDTLRSRSIHIRMEPAVVRKRFTFAEAKSLSLPIVEHLRNDLEAKREQIESGFLSFAGLNFLEGREEELWSPLFVLCEVLCPERREELERAAADIYGDKRTNARYHAELRTKAERLAEVGDSRRLTNDILTVMTADRVRSTELLQLLKAQPRMPWRTYQGAGLDFDTISRLLKPYGAEPQAIRFKDAVGKGYYRKAVELASSRLASGSALTEIKTEKHRQLSFKLDKKASTNIRRATKVFGKQWELVSDGNDVKMTIRGNIIGNVYEQHLGQGDGSPFHLVLIEPPLTIAPADYDVRVTSDYVMFSSGSVTYQSGYAVTSEYDRASIDMQVQNADRPADQ